MVLKNVSMIFRHIFRYRSYSFINIIGLAIGMACAMLIILWVKDEMNTDKFHKNGKDIYLLRKQMRFSDGQITIDPSSTSPLGPAIAEEVPEVVAAVRITWNMRLLFRLGEKAIYERGFYADSTFFSVFSFNLIHGDPHTVLNSPNTVAISKKLAEKYFGNDNPMGKTIIIRHQKEELFTITGVFEDVSPLSSVQFDYVLPFSKYYELGKQYLHWGNYNLMTLVQAKPNTNPDILSKKIDQVLKKYDQWARRNVTIFARTIEDAYLYGEYNTLIDKPSGRIVLVKIFSIVAIFIIFLACMNYTNLATALAIKRAKEVGVKKVFGSDKRKLIIQFTAEALLLTFIAFFLSIIIVEAALPYSKLLLGKEISSDLRNIHTLAGFFIVPVVTGIIAGAFPAFYLSSFKPVKVLKSIFTPKKGIHTRHILVIFQFVITIVFIISSFVIVKQIKYIQNKTLGLDKSNVVFFYQTIQIQKERKSFKQELKKQEGVLSVSYTDSNPLQINSSTTDPKWRGKPSDQNFLFPYMVVDEDFTETLGVEIIEGRDFSELYSSDKNCILINEEAVKVMQLKNPVGEIVNYWGRKATIVGVVKDFHIGSLRVPIHQLMITCRPEETEMVMIKISGNNKAKTLKNIEKVFREYESNVPFEYEFLDKEFEKGYEGEKAMSRFSNVFAVLAIIISCLGLFGLALFTAEQKTKEIGIRKSMGAKTYQIILLLGRDFLKLIGISFVIASVIAYFVLNAWLNYFAYRTEFSWWIFAITGIITLAIAMITVSWQSWVAACRNPIESLRYE